MPAADVHPLEVSADNRRMRQDFGGIRLGWTAALSLLLAAAGCSPTLNWREVRPPDAGWVGLFPCRPSQQSKTVDIGGKAVAWQVQVCQAGGATFAVAQVDVGDPAQVPSVLKALRALAFEQSPAGAVRPVPYAMPGMTPQSEAGRWVIQRQGPQDRGRALELALVARGTRVVEGLLISSGGDLSDQMAQPFFDGLRFEP